MVKLIEMDTDFFNATYRSKFSSSQEGLTVVQIFDITRAQYFFSLFCQLPSLRAKLHHCALLSDL